MKKETSCGAVLYRKDKKRLYLVLKYEEGHWDFPKGHIEKGETQIETLKREIEEETSITNLEIIKGFKHDFSYIYTYDKKEILKKVIFFIAKTNEEKVKLSNEHTDYKWLNFNKALEILTYDNAKELLKKANKYLEEN